MAAPAAPLPGRRVSLGSVAVLAGALLLAPPLFVLAPFVVLSVLARPHSLRELVALIGAGVGLGLSLQGSSALVPDLIRAAGLVLAAVFGFLSFRTRAGLFPRALLAVLLTALALFVWEWVRGVTWPEMHRSFATMLEQSYRSLLPPESATASSTEVRNLVQTFIDSASAFARALPGLLALQGMAGVAIAWLWHHKLAAAPLGLPPAPFRTFRFNDQLVWGAIFTLALYLVGLPAEGQALTESLLIFWVGLYAMRGLAVAAAVLAFSPAPLRGLLVLLALLLSPLTLGACVALGLGDTWIDIRRRLPSAESGGI